MELDLRLGNGGSHHHFFARFFHPPTPPTPSSPPPSPPPVLHLDLLPPTPRPSSQTHLSEGAAAAVFTDVISTAAAETAVVGSYLQADQNNNVSGGGGGGGGGGIFEVELGDYNNGNYSEEDQMNFSSRKKLRLSRQQSAFLEESFKEHHTLYPKQKVELARRLNLRPRQVEVWFQNRRARTKLKQTEVDCEYLKKCCETLTQENRKLQKELQDLRALKTTDSLFIRSPATTLTMCASCERAVKHHPPPPPPPYFFTNNN